jgi:hypothetical protein
MNGSSIMSRIMTQIAALRWNDLQRILGHLSKFECSPTECASLSWWGGTTL